MAKNYTALIITNIRLSHDCHVSAVPNMEVKAISTIKLLFILLSARVVIIFNLPGPRPLAGAQCWFLLRQLQQFFPGL
jgi:hypothetical protein